MASALVLSGMLAAAAAAPHGANQVPCAVSQAVYGMT
jgi:hypothetical protein